MPKFNSLVKLTLYPFSVLLLDTKTISNGGRYASGIIFTGLLPPFPGFLTYRSFSPSLLLQFLVLFDRSDFLYLTKAANVCSNLEESVSKDVFTSHRQEVLIL